MWDVISILFLIIAFLFTFYIQRKTSFPELVNVTRALKASSDSASTVPGGSKFKSRSVLRKNEILLSVPQLWLENVWYSSS